MMIANIGLPYYDVTSSKDSEKRLILIPQEPLNEHQQSCVKKAFVTMGVFNEVTTSDAADLLKIIASPKPQPPLDLPAIVRKIPHRTTIHLTPNNGNGSTTNKENASRVEVPSPFLYIVMEPFVELDVCWVLIGSRDSHQGCG